MAYANKLILKVTKPRPLLSQNDYSPHNIILTCVHLFFF